MGRSRRLAVEVPYFSLVPGLLVGSDLVATVPERVATHFALRGDFEVLAPPLPLPDIDICMAWHPAFAADPAQAWLREILQTVARDV